ncbi:unnamed protein product [Caenorhabditis bovis]|uniref:Uncharacterized protein n=1 Tax=Caenorhabditis bovis TaxID=2654633 RepID=A0A8S1EW94_9PELO|nr:unnamed protein product [Caenorhabditis bovis]
MESSTNVNSDLSDLVQMTSSSSSTNIPNNPEVAKIYAEVIKKAVFKFLLKMGIQSVDELKDQLKTRKPFTEKEEEEEEEVNEQIRHEEQSSTISPMPREEFYKLLNNGIDLKERHESPAHNRRSSIIGNIIPMSPIASEVSFTTTHQRMARRRSSDQRMFSSTRLATPKSVQSRWATVMPGTPNAASTPVKHFTPTII